MSMPERIWAGLWESVDRVRTGWQEHEPKKSNRFQEISFEDATEYIRYDIHQRAIERLELVTEIANKQCVEIFYLTGDDPFVCGAYGKFSIENLEQIITQCTDPDLTVEYFLNGSGTYTFEAKYEPAQYGDFGRMELPGYWDLNFIKHEPITEIPE